MPRYQLRLEWTDELPSYSEAKKWLAEFWEEIDNLDPEGTAEFVGSDVQSLPRGVESRAVTRVVETEDEGEFEFDPRDQHVQFVPDNMGVTHPWDQGLFIFPEDHPLHHLEKAAREGTDSPDYERERQTWLETGKLALPPAPPESDPED